MSPKSSDMPKIRSKRTETEIKKDFFDIITGALKDTDAEKYMAAKDETDETGVGDYTLENPLDFNPTNQIVNKKIVKVCPNNSIKIYKIMWDENAVNEIAHKYKIEYECGLVRFQNLGSAVSDLSAAPRTATPVFIGVKDYVRLDPLCKECSNTLKKSTGSSGRKSKPNKRRSLKLRSFKRRSLKRRSFKKTYKKKNKHKTRKRNRNKY